MQTSSKKPGHDAGVGAKKAGYTHGATPSCTRHFSSPRRVPSFVFRSFADVRPVVGFDLFGGIEPLTEAVAVADLPAPPLGIPSGRFR